MQKVHILLKKNNQTPPYRQQHSFSQFFSRKHTMEGKNNKFYFIHSDVLTIHINIRMAKKCHAIYNCIFVYNIV